MGSSTAGAGKRSTRQPAIRSSSTTTSPPDAPDRHGSSPRAAHPASAPPSYACFRPKPDPIRPQPVPAVSAGWANTVASAGKQSSRSALHGRSLRTNPRRLVGRRPRACFRRKAGTGRPDTGGLRRSTFGPMHSLVGPNPAGLRPNQPVFRNRLGPQSGSFAGKTAPSTAGAVFPDKEEVPGSSPGSPIARLRLCRAVSWA